MKAITIRQPWASLIAAGVKTIETRPRRTSYRGRIAIHAGKAGAGIDPRSGYGIGTYDDGEALWRLRPSDDPAYEIVPGIRAARGAVVASAVLTDCAPIGGPYDFRTGYVEGDEGDYPGQAVVVHHPPMGPMGAYLGLSNADTSTTDITDQLPYGDFTPGRWALLLDDIKPTTERCPACWGSAMTGLCGRTDLGSDGPCVMRSGHAERGTPCWGENDVAGDWTPAASCRTCCVCPCGSTDDGTECPYCHTTRTPGRCPPIPARGQQAVPWEWTP